MIKYMHSNGIRMGLNINPKIGINSLEQNYDNVTKYLEVNDNGVVPFNVFDPRFMDVYLKVLIHPLENINVDFYWLDFNFDSKLELWAINHYHFLDMSRNYKIRPMLLTSNSLIAEHRYPVKPPAMLHLEPR